MMQKMCKFAGADTLTARELRPQERQVSHVTWFKLPRVPLGPHVSNRVPESHSKISNLYTITVQSSFIHKFLI